MKRSICVALLMTSVAAQCFAALDLTPTVTQYTAEGITFKQLLFKDGKQVISYEPPPVWTFQFTGDALQLTPPKRERAEAIIRAVPLAAPQALDAKAAGQLKQQFVTALPPASQATTLVSEELNPVVVETFGSYEVVASYKALGQTFMRSALFVNLPDTQLVFRLTCLKDDFEALHRAFRASVLSWHHVDPQQEKPAASPQPD